MKVCLMSDSHGNTHVMKQVIQREQPDLVLHAGDCAADVTLLASKSIFRNSALKMIAVAGNCDLPGAAKLEEILSLDDLQIFLTHGHRYQVKEGYLALVYKAQEVQANLIAFGHTHVPAAFVEQGKLFINPGSLSLPRGYRTPTYVMFEKTRDQERPLTIVFKSAVNGSPCNDLSIQAAWDLQQQQFIFIKNL